MLCLRHRLAARATPECRFDLILLPCQIAISNCCTRMDGWGQRNPPNFSFAHFFDSLSGYACHQHISIMNIPISTIQIQWRRVSKGEWIQYRFGHRRTQPEGSTGDRGEERKWEMESMGTLRSEIKQKLSVGARTAKKKKKLSEDTFMNIRCEDLALVEALVRFMGSDGVPMHACICLCPYLEYAPSWLSLAQHIHDYRAHPPRLTKLSTV